MINDLRFGIRMLAKNPAFTAVAVLSLALGIGANTAIFQLLNAVRLKSLPIRNAGEVAQIRLREHDVQLTRGNKGLMRYGPITNPLWERVRKEQQGFSSIAAWGIGGFNLAQGGEVRPARGLWVSGNFFNVLGVNPELGRVFNEDDDRRGCSAPGVVISHGFWQSEFGGASDVVGRKLTVSDQQLAVIGVTPPSFFGLEVGKSFDVAIPICADPIFLGANTRLDSGITWWLMPIGRLKPGWTIDQASAQLNSISTALFKETLPSNYPTVSVNDYLNSKLEVVSGSSGYSILRQDYERPLWVLLAIAGLVLLITCANLANLLLARASTREREIAVRQAVGASRLRILRQLLIENLLLAGIGSALAAGLAQPLTRVLVASIGTQSNIVFLDVTPDFRVLVFSVGVAVLTCVFFGLTPALRATRINPGAAMKAAGRGLTASRERFSLRRGLVVFQVALSLVLVASAFLFTRSLNKLSTLDAGFNQDDLLISSVGFNRLKIEPEQRLTFRAELLERIKNTPGVDDVAEMDTYPLTGGGRGNHIWLEGKTSDSQVPCSFNRVGVDYLKTLQIPLVAGRSFSTADSINAPAVAIINQTLARKLGEANLVGKRMVVEATPGDPESIYEIIGVARDAKFEDLREEELAVVYLASTQDKYPSLGRRYLVRSNLPPAELTASIKRNLMQFNSGLDVTFQVFRTMVQESLLRERLMAQLSGFFGLLALLLASIGLYGLLSYAVASRTNEIGIRIALGAGTRDVLSLILKESLVLVLIGVGIGVPVVLYAVRFAQSLLFDLSPQDPVSLIGASLVLLFVAVLAGYWPARRATKVDPLVALRDE
jgi:predicted permease